MKGVNIFLADGFEDIEAIATHDILRRGGVDSQLVAITDEPFVESSHGITIGVDAFLPDLSNDHSGTTAEDIMIFPGGMPGSKNLSVCTPLIDMMNAHYAAGGSVAAICAAPGLVLSRLADLKGTVFTCFEGFQDALIAKGAIYDPQPAVVSGRIITGRSAGHALAFALEILSRLKSPQTVESVHRDIFLY